MTSSGGLQIFSTCPQSTISSQGEYVRWVADVARWSEDAGCEGILVYTDNSLVDPWLTAQVILEHTERLCPLVAVQPIYMHPYTAAKMVATLGYLHGRRLWLNMLAGGFRNDLLALNDPTPHDERYERTVEYTLIMKRLLADDAPVSEDGRYYNVKNLRMSPPLPSHLLPRRKRSMRSPCSIRSPPAKRNRFEMSASALGSASESLRVILLRRRGGSRRHGSQKTGGDK
jgi:alkanesulfonate monooxygenase